MSEDIYNREDSLGYLNGNGSLAEKLAALHTTVRSHCPFIDRIAVALYDAQTDHLKTFIHSSDTSRPLVHYQSLLTASPSLQAIVTQGKPRVVNDTAIFSAGTQEHNRRILAAGYGASYTMPMYMNGRFCGFIFFNSRQKGVFTEESLHHLDLFGHLMALLIVHELQQLRNLVNAVHTARDMVHQRDHETGTHIDRMSRYARLIAIHLADQHRLDDNFIEHLFMFAPLHDIGKLAIPDHILLKPGALTAEERRIMQEHALKGRQLIDTMLAHFELQALEHSAMLRNIAELHHETLDGSGYPHGLKGTAIPIEAHIIAVADIFDALTSRRPYKEAWSNQEAIATLQHMAGHALDRDCVDALVANLEQVERIQAEFQENPYA